MRLTQFSDFSLRALIFLAVSGESESLWRIAAAYGVSHNHMVKVVALLQKAGFVHTRRGPGGGVTLARAPEDINLRDVVMASEPDFAIAPCMAGGAGGCRIAGLCDLTHVLCRARDAFLDEMGRHSLADVIRNREQLAALLLTADEAEARREGAETPMPAA